MKKVLVQALMLHITIFLLVVGCKKEEKVILPTVETSQINEVSINSATCGGKLTSNGGAEIIAQGVCWSTSITPMISDNKTIDGTELNFISKILNLNPATEYYVRAYATNRVGTSYGRILSFYTLGNLPTFETPVATNVKAYSATLSCIVNAHSLNTTVTFEYGFTTNYGQIALLLSNPVSGTENRQISVDLNLLTPGSTYHCRLKTVNSLGFNYSDDITFTTIGLAPSVSAFATTNILSNSATLNTYINPNSLSTNITFEYGTTNNYGEVVTAKESPIDGGLYTSISVDITGLKAGTTYYARIKAVNELGTVYGNITSFTTLGNAPNSGTQEASNISTNSASLNGYAEPNDLSTEIIFEYGTTINYGQSATILQSPISGDSRYNIHADIKGLTANTTYHFRTKATNEIGISYGNDITFITFYGSVTDIDGNIYNTVKIGSQIWMAGNLKTTKFNDGSSIPITTANLDWEHLTGSGYCWYNNDMLLYKEIFGALYNWYTANATNIAPIGWHVPIETEWKALIDYLGGTSVAGGKLQSNETGFSGRLTGYRTNNGTYGYPDITGRWWSNTGDTSSAFVTSINISDIQIMYWNLYKTFGYSIRCIKD